jgi:hypothetical protein
MRPRPEGGTDDPAGRLGRLPARAVVTRRLLQVLDISSCGRSIFNVGEFHDDPANCPRLACRSEWSLTTS